MPKIGEKVTRHGIWALLGLFGVTFKKNESLWSVGSRRVPNLDLIPENIRSGNAFLSCNGIHDMNLFFSRIN